MVGAATGQVERVDRVPGRLEWSGHGLPAPCASERAVDEDEARHRTRAAVAFKRVRLRVVAPDERWSHLATLEADHGELFWVLDAEGAAAG